MRLITYTPVMRATKGGMDAGVGDALQDAGEIMVGVGGVGVNGVEVDGVGVGEGSDHNIL